MAADKAILALNSMLVDTVSENDTIFIVTHIDPDFDTIGSAIALADSINTIFGKEVHIIIDDDYSTIKSGIKYIINEVKDKFSIITQKELPNLITDKSLLIVADANAENRISVKDTLPKFNDILVIDHHSRNERTIETGKKYINGYMSSVSEIVSRLLFSLGYKIPPAYATYLYAGIRLDTDKFKNNMNNDTNVVISKLAECGADLTQVDNLFKEDPYHTKLILELIKKGRVIEIFNTKVALASDFDGEPAIYFQEDLAKVAAGLLNDKIDISFALGYIAENTIAISTRSRGNINAATIMNGYGGGGKKWAAATRINYLPVENTTPRDNSVKQQTLKDLEASLLGFMVSGGYFFQQTSDIPQEGKKEYTKNPNSKRLANQ